MTRVAFIGLGTMGSRQAAQLVAHGFELTVYNRTRATADAWAAEHGAQVAATPREAAAHADVVCSMVVDGPQVRDVLLGGSDGAVHGARPGTVFLDMTTISPRETLAIGAELEAAGMRMVDAPVTGSAPKAQAGTLTIMCGGTADDVERVRPLLDAMGAKVVHCGPLGQGETVKLIGNAVSAINCATLAQALVAGKAIGADLDALVEVMGVGSAGSAMLDLKAQPMLAHDFAPLFKLEHMLKDVRLCLEETQAAGVPFPAAAAARDLYAGGMGRDLGGADFSAVLTVVEALADTRL